MKEEKEEWINHPSFGQVNFSRVSGRVSLYGSHVDFLDHFISLRIHQSQVKHDLNRDWYHANNEIIEVFLSPAQFAELLTTMNYGGGVPCTIRSRDGKYIKQREEKLPSEANKIKDDFEERVKGFVAEVGQLVREGKELLSKKNRLTKCDREKLEGIIDKVDREIGSNWTFAVESFQEAAEKVVTESKAEIEAMLSGIVQDLGTRALQERAYPVLQLPESNRETNNED